MSISRQTVSSSTIVLVINFDEVWLVRTSITMIVHNERRRVLTNTKRYLHTREEAEYENVERKEMLVLLLLTSNDT